MEDTDAFEMDDGWGCDSPSAVLSPTAALSDPLEEAVGGDIAADELNDKDFGWEVADADRQFGIPTPPKPAVPGPPSPAPLFQAPVVNHLPPAASPAGPPPFAYSSSVSGQNVTTHQQFQSESTTTSSMTFAASVPPPLLTPTPAAPTPVADELEYTERNSWGEPWEDAEPFPDQKVPSPVAATGLTTVATALPLNLSVAAAESIPVANEFWGDQEDEVLFDEDEHANEKWDETPVVHQTAEDLTKLSLQGQDQEAASTRESADTGTQQYHQSPPISTFAPATYSAEPSPSRFGYATQAHSQFQSSSNSPTYEARTGYDGNSPVGFTGSSPARLGVTFGSAPPSTFVPEASPPVPATAPAFQDDKPVEGNAGEHHLASTPAKDTLTAEVSGFSQPQAEYSEYHLHATAGFEGNSTGYDHQQQHQTDQLQAFAEPLKDWQEHAPETHTASDAPWDSSSASPSKEDQFSSNNATYYQHGETAAAVQFEPTHVEGGVEQEETAGVSSPPPFDSAGGAGAFQYRDNSSREEAQFYASVRDHERSSAASIGGDVSSAGATFGSSDYVGDGAFSDGNFSETRSIVGSSNASTAFGTDFPSVSEGFSAAATTFGGSDYVSDGQFSDGNVSETPSLNDSSNPGAETGSSGPPLSSEGQNYYGGEDADNSGEPNPFELSGNSSSGFNGEDGGFPSTPSTALFNQDSATGAVSEEVNPFASSPSPSRFSPSTDQSFQSNTPFGAPPVESVPQSDYVPTAASLFGATAGSDVPNPFGDSSSSAFAEKELPVAVTDDLFVSSAPATGFGGGSSFGQPPQQYSDQGYQHHHQSYDQGYQQQHNQGGHAQPHHDQAVFGQSHAAYNEPSHLGQTASPASAGELFDQSQGSFDGFSSTSSSAFGQQQQQQQQDEFGYAQQQQQTPIGSAYAGHNQYEAGGSADSHFAQSTQHAARSEFGSETQAFGSESPGAHFGHSSAHSYAGSSSSVGTVHTETAGREQTQSYFGHLQAQAPPAHKYAQSAHSDSLSNSGFSESHTSQSSASTQSFFGGAASFPSSSEFFGGAASSSADEFSRTEQSQPNLSRGTSNTSAYSEQTADYRQPEEQANYQQQSQHQSWSQPGSFAPPGYVDESFSAPPPPPPPTHELFDALTPSGDARQAQSSPSYGSNEVSHVPVSAPSAFGHVDTAGHASFDQASEVPLTVAFPPALQETDHYQAHFVPPPPTVAEPSPQQQDDASSNYFSSADASGSGFGDQFADSSSMFGAPPPQDSSASSSYFGDQPSPPPPAFGGFEQSAPSGFGQPPSSEFFSSAPQHQNAPAAAAFGSPYQAPAPQDSYQQHQQQQQQAFHQTAHGYGGVPVATPAPQVPVNFNNAPAAPAPQAPVNFNNSAAHGASSAQPHQTSNFYGQAAAAAAATAVAATSYTATDYNTPAHSGYGAAVTGYGAAHKQASAPITRSNKYKDPCVPAPSCLASFGFGGNVVTMFPKRKLRLNIAGSSFRNSPRAPVYVFISCKPFHLLETLELKTVIVCFPQAVSPRRQLGAW